MIHKTEIESPRTALEISCFESTNESNTIDIQSTVFNSENLISCPLTVNTIDINYAKSSTNLDTKRLKALIWDILTTNALVNNFFIVLFIKFVNFILIKYS